MKSIDEIVAELVSLSRNPTPSVMAIRQIAMDVNALPRATPAPVAVDGLRVDRVPHSDGAITYEVDGHCHVLRSPEWGMTEPLLTEQSADESRIPAIVACIRAAREDIQKETP